MTKPELVKAVATEAEMTNKDAEKAVNWKSSRMHWSGEKRYS